MSNRRRHVGDREAPETSTCLGVFGLSLYTTERELEKEFTKFGPLEKVTVVLDGKVRITRLTVAKQLSVQFSLLQGLEPFTSDSFYLRKQAIERVMLLC